MDVLNIEVKENMREFNIYAGLKAEGKPSYYSTILAESLDEAMNYAYECSMVSYDLLLEDGKVKSWEEVAFDLGFNPVEGEEMSDEEQDKVTEAFNIIIRNTVDYDAIPTDEDDIPESQLVREHDLQ